MAIPWWQDAVIYQLSLRSFSDSNGDGIGDIQGAIQRLPYLATLGVDAIWLNPCYLSPQHDFGYDIADYFSLDPTYGDLTDFSALISEARRFGIRVLMDLVPNHCSSEHAWFKDALKSPPESPQRKRFLFRDGQAGGIEPPNNWQSVFGGSAWTRVSQGPYPGQWYLHSFDTSQPDFNWRNPDVHKYFESVLNYWYSKGVAGFRIDVAHGLYKDEDLPDITADAALHGDPMWNQPEVHDVYRSWHNVSKHWFNDNSYLVGEVWLPDPELTASYLATDELSQVFAFDLLVQPWNASFVRHAITKSLKYSAGSHGPAWVLSNHDVHRPVTRYGQDQSFNMPDPTDMISAARRLGPTDLSLGDSRARAMLMLELALPGTTYLYQGEELGLPEVLDLPPTARRDPIWLRSHGEQIGRDGCRVPLPWDASLPSFGFSPEGSAKPWLPQPPQFASYAARQQADDSSSFLCLTQELIHKRHHLFPRSTPINWLVTDSPDVLAFRRSDAACIVNFGTNPYSIPDEWMKEVICTSAKDSLETAEGKTYLQPDKAVWLQM